MKRDPLLKAMDAAHKTTPHYTAHQLLAEEARWKRKLTIATNKLDDVRKRKDAFLLSLVAPKESDSTKKQ